MGIKSQPIRDDRGDTLLELLIAAAIIAIAVVAILGAFGTSILTSDIHRKQATAGTYVRSYAEAVESAIAASPSAYVADCDPGYAPGFTVPSGYVKSITAVSFWDGAAWTDPEDCAAAAAVDIGVQKVSLRVASGDDRAIETLDVIVRRPCAPPPAPADAACV